MTRHEHRRFVERREHGWGSLGVGLEVRVVSRHCMGVELRTNLIKENNFLIKKIYKTNREVQFYTQILEQCILRYELRRSG